MRMIGAAGAVAIGLAACSPVDAIDAAQLLRTIQPNAAAPEPAGPAATVVSWTHRGHRVEGDLYAPVAGPAEAALVLAPGLGREGRRDPRLVALAAALAQERFAVLVPDVPSFQAQRVEAADAALLADAIRYLLARPEGERPVGAAAISYAVGPIFLAALEPDLAARLSFIVAVGGYYDTEAIVTFFTTGFFREDETAPWQHGEPNAFGKWVFVLANAERLESASDRVALTAMARHKLADIDADVTDLTVGLRPEGRAVVDLLDNRDPARVPALIARLPEKIRDDLRGLSLKGRDLRALRAQVILIHGRDDAIIPYTESLALARALSPDRVHLALLDSLAHADLGPTGFTDAFRLWQAAYVLMRQRQPAAR